MLHAADVTTLTQVKEELDGYSVKLRAAEDSAKEATERLALEKVGWSEQRRLSGEERTRLQERIAEMMQQNELLHDNLDKVCYGCWQ